MTIHEAQVHLLQRAIADAHWSYPEPTREPVAVREPWWANGKSGFSPDRVSWWRRVNWRRGTKVAA